MSHASNHNFFFIHDFAWLKAIILTLSDLSSRLEDIYFRFLLLYHIS